MIMNEELDICKICKIIGISERELFPERYMNDKEKQEYIEGYINFLKDTLERIKKGE